MSALDLIAIPGSAPKTITPNPKACAEKLGAHRNGCGSGELSFLFTTAFQPNAEEPTATGTQLLADDIALTDNAGRN